MKRGFVLIALMLTFPAVARAGDVTMVARDIPLGARLLQASPPPIRFNMLGLHWQGPGTVWYRTRSGDGPWRTWRAADADAGPDAGSREASSLWHDGNLDWTDSATSVQFRTRGKVARLRAFYLWSRVTRRPMRKLSVAGSPSIVPRTDWEADEKIVQVKPRYAATLKLAVVHHTAGTNDYTAAEAPAIVRGIEVYHVQANGWNDIGYNFLVDRFGNVYEGRGGGMTRNVVGAHSQGFNKGSVGVALMGNFTAARPPAVMQEALVRLLAWRLDIAHLDPVSTVSFTSGGNAKFKTGKVVTLRAVSGHRDTGPTECPGRRAYALLGPIANRVAQTGLPKLYAPAVTRSPDGSVHFEARLSSPLLWTITVTAPTGAVVARHTELSAALSWTWSSPPAGGERFAWSMSAGPNLVPASGSLRLSARPVPSAQAVGPAVLPALPAKPVVPAKAVATAKPVVPATPIVTAKPVVPATPVVRAKPVVTAPANPVAPVPAPLPAVPVLLSGVTSAPTVLTPGAGDTGGSIVVDFVLGTPAHVTVQVEAAAGTSGASLRLLAADVASGQSSFEWDVGALADGRYSVVVRAQAAAGKAVIQSTPLTVDRTLANFTLTPAAFSPNGDGVADTLGFAFTLGQSAPVQIVVQRAGAPVATVFSGQLGPGAQSLGWDGANAGARLADGDYVAVVTATDALGTVSLLQPFSIDTAPPGLTTVDGATLRFTLGETATVTAVVNGQTIVVPAVAGAFGVPWSSGPVASFTIQARDAAGNSSALLSGP